MKTNSPLFIIGVVFFLAYCNSVSAQNSGNCEVKATVEISESQAAQTSGNAEVKIQDGTGPFKYIFYENLSGKLLQKNFEKSRVDNLPKGSYHCIIIDNRGCTKKIEFQIQ